jgi:GNAT superfamily N-acetyltransferase
MNSKFEIRRCRRDDFEDLLMLLRQLWPDEELNRPGLKNVFDCALVSDSKVYLCAVDGESVTGFVSLTIKNNLWQAAKLGHIDELVVDQKHRGRGLGTRLLNAIMAVAKERGCTRVELDSAFHRKEAHTFYERHGFENRAYLFSKSLA